MTIDLKPNKPKKCKHKECEVKFIQFKSTDIYCSLDCKIADTVKQVRKNKEVEWREKKKVLKEKNRDYKKELQDQMNKIARLIDYGNVCVSCGNYPKKAFGAHFRSVGGHVSIRYNLNNIYIGCFSCNGKKGGNVHGYNEGIEKTFGKAWLEYISCGLLQDYPTLQLKRVEFPELIKTAKGIVKELEKDLKVRTPEERLQMREIYNERMGIYLNNKHCENEEMCA